MKRSAWALVLIAPIACAYAGCAGDASESAMPNAVLDAGSDAEPGEHFTEDAGTDADASVPRVLACMGTECPFPLTTCQGADGTFGYKCDVNLLTDDDNCGACGNVCPNEDVFGVLQMTTHCVNGRCERTCWNEFSTQNFADCNGRVDDGCEVNVLHDVNNCGACGKKCPDGVEVCTNARCGCPYPETYCGGVGCVNTFTNANHCGGCGNVCETPAEPPPPFMQYACESGECGKLVCFLGRGDCNGDLSDGCEVDLYVDPENCAACGNKCNPGQICGTDMSSYAAKCLCDSGEAVCTNAYGQTLCTNLLTDPDNCGACGNVCPGSSLERNHNTRICRKGYCDIQCAAGWGDCDGLVGNGCETNLMVNTNHCGACGKGCDLAAGQPCIEGECLMIECDAGTVR